MGRGFVGKVRPVTVLDPTLLYSSVTVTGSPVVPSPGGALPETAEAPDVNLVSDNGRPLSKVKPAVLIADEVSFISVTVLLSEYKAITCCTISDISPAVIICRLLSSV
jgi:hypothetical protein